MSITFGGVSTKTVLDAVSECIHEFDHLAIAVSYVQLSGWDLLLPLIGHSPHTVRLICTDQLAITDPAAIRAMRRSGVTVHAYTGPKIYHPKIFIASKAGQADQWVLGSANLSRSALTSSVEVVYGSRASDGEALVWFDTLFAHESSVFDETRLAALEASFAARIKGGIATARAKGVPSNIIAQDMGALETIEATFASLPITTVPLNIDKAGNNVRTLDRVKQVLDNVHLLKGKALNELKLLGFAHNTSYSELGTTTQDKTITDIATIWTRWLKNASLSELHAANPSGRLIQARKAFDAFWLLPEPITDYFLAYCTNPNPKIRRSLQAIELIANTERFLPSLSVDDILELSLMLDATSQLKPEVKNIVDDYLVNKGTRSWNVADRELILRAWKSA